MTIYGKDVDKLPSNEQLNNLIKKIRGKSSYVERSPLKPHNPSMWDPYADMEAFSLGRDLFSLKDWARKGRVLFQAWLAEGRLIARTQLAIQEDRFVTYLEKKLDNF